MYRADLEQRHPAFYLSKIKSPKIKILFLQVQVYQLIGYWPFFEINIAILRLLTIALAQAYNSSAEIKPAKSKDDNRKAIGL